MAAPAYLLTPPVLDRRITLDPGEVAPTGDTYRYDVQWTSVNGVTRFGRYYVEAGRLVLNSVDADRADLPEFNVDDVLTLTWGGYSLSVTLTVVDFVRGGFGGQDRFPDLRFADAIDLTQATGELTLAACPRNNVLYELYRLR